MNQYVNVTGGVLTLPVPGQNASKVVGPGESFVGPAFYDRWVSQGLLAKFRTSICSSRHYVSPDDVAPSEANAVDSIGAYRYKRNSDTASTSSGQTKALLFFDREIQTGENMMIMYFFYTFRNTPNAPSHTAQVYEQFTGCWTFPNWAALPSNFYELNPKAQIEALLARQV
jgi:hypothetical protein